MAGHPQLRDACSGRPPTSRRSATSCSPRTGASFDNPEFVAGATKIKEWVDKGYFNKNFNGTDYDPAWQAFAKGKSRYLIAGTWVTADLAEQMGDDVGFMLMPGKDPTRPVSLGGESLPFTITSSAKNPDVAAAYIDFLTDANAAKVLVDTDNLPAMKDAPAPTGGVSAEVATAWQKLNEADGVIPYLDYTTPTFYDDISGAIQELLAGKQDPAAVHQGRAGEVRQVGGVPLTSLRGSPDDRPPGEPRLVGYLYLLPAFAVFAAFVLYPLCNAALDLALRLGRADGRHVGGPRQLRRRLHGRGAAQRVRARAGAADLLRGAAAARSGCCWPGVMARARVRGLALFRTILFLPQVIAMVVVAVMWKMIYDPDNGVAEPLPRACSASRASRGWATSRWRCRRSG